MDQGSTPILREVSVVPERHTRGAGSWWCETHKRLCVEGCDGWGIYLRVRVVQALVCVPLLLGTATYGDNGILAECCEENRSTDPEGAQYHGCQVEQYSTNIMLRSSQ